jgi:hypothetical protein
MPAATDPSARIPSVIPFSCPSCKKELRTHDAAAGRKVVCTGCGQQLLVPSPAPDQNKAAPGQSAAVLPPGTVVVGCPGCGRAIPLPPGELGWNIECSRCGRRFVPVPGQPPPPAPTEDLDESDYGQQSLASAFGTELSSTYPQTGIGGRADDLPFVTSQKHSELGIASFVIAVLVGGLDIMMAILITISIARSTAPPQRPGYRERTELRENVVAGGVSTVCVNCMSVPLCMVGAALGLVALFVHPGYNHVFTWIGLIGNLVVILGDIFLYALVMFDR